MKIKLSTIVLALSLILTSTLMANTYSSEEYNCQIKFPTEFEEEVKDGDETTTVTVSATKGGMIYMLTIIVYKELEDELKENNDVVEALRLLTSAENLGAKVKSKNIMTFNVSGEKGFYANIKAKLSGSKYIGNYLVIMKDNILYQFTALGLKKEYNQAEASRFESSFDFK
ncbi:MAG: hypothetical protein ACWA41_10110 [Putridiphycobacter sp.]